MDEKDEVCVNEDTREDQYLIFTIENESYGIPIRYITEIISIVEITQVPELPVYVKGIINLRGEIIPIMDARLRFKMKKKEYDNRTCIIVIEIEEVSFGLVVDDVREVENINGTDLAPPPYISGSEDYAYGFIEAIGKAKGGIRLLIDCRKLLYNNKLDDFR